MMCSAEKWLKIEAAFNAGLLNHDILRSCLPLLVLTLNDIQSDFVSVNEIQCELAKKYEFHVALPFLREVIALASKEGVLSSIHKDKIKINRENIQSYEDEKSGIAQNLLALANLYKDYCKEKGYGLPDNIVNLNDWIVDSIRRFDSKVLSNDLEERDNLSTYHWCEFVLQLKNQNHELFKFIASLSYSSVLMDATFYVAKKSKRKSYSNLNVYLDTPVALALLGLDGEDRVSAVRYVINQLKNCGCSLSVFAHNLDEMERIIKGVEYHMREGDFAYYRANRVGKAFFNWRYNASQISLFRLKLIDALSNNKVRIVDASRIISSESEKRVVDVEETIRGCYSRGLSSLNEFAEESIEVDAKSLIAVRKLRLPNVGNELSTTQHIMITLNDSLSTAAKRDIYGIKRAMPACMSADLLGAVLWMDDPESLIDYKAHRLLSDCVLFMKPTQQMVARLSEELTLVVKNQTITEDDLALLQASSAVDGALMESIKCDVKNINSSTPIDVCERIRRRISEEVSGQLRLEQSYRALEKEEHLRVKLELKAELEERVRFHTNRERRQHFISAWRTVHRIFVLLICSSGAAMGCLFVLFASMAVTKPDLCIKTTCVLLSFIIIMCCMFSHKTRCYLKHISVKFARKMLGKSL